MRVTYTSYPLGTTETGTEPATRASRTWLASWFKTDSVGSGLTLFSDHQGLKVQPLSFKKKPNKRKVLRWRSGVLANFLAYSRSKCAHAFYWGTRHLAVSMNQGS